MVNEKAKLKFHKYYERIKTQDESLSFITYCKNRYVYLLKNKVIPIDAMKIWTDCGKGLEELVSFKDASSPNIQNLAIIIKDNEKLIFKDQCEKFYSFGIKGVTTEVKKLVVFIKSGSGDMLIFASTETNSIEILMKHIRSQNDAILECLFDGQTNSVSKINSDGGVVNEIFS